VATVAESLRLDLEAQGGAAALASLRAAAEKGELRYVVDEWSQAA
jgi:hypothetical protein